MKKILFGLIILLFTSCQSGYTIQTNNATIINIERYDTGLALYEIQSIPNNRNVSYTTYFIDSIGKFNIGDQIQIIKK